MVFATCCGACNAVASGRWPRGQAAQRGDSRHRRDDRRYGWIRDARVAGYTAAKVAVEQLIEAVPDLKKVANVKGEQVGAGGERKHDQ